MHTYNIGDRVELVKRYGDIPPGTKGTVEDLISESYRPESVNVVYDGFENDGLLYTYSNEIRPVVDLDSIPPPPKRTEIRTDKNTTVTVVSTKFDIVGLDFVDDIGDVCTNMSRSKALDLATALIEAAVN